MDNSSVSTTNTSSTVRRKVGKIVCISRESLNSLAEPKSQANVLEDLCRGVHKNLAGNFAQLEKESLKSMDRIQVMLKAASAIHARQPAPDASGNHISRATGAVSLEPLGDFKVKRKSPRYKYEKATLDFHATVSNPEWNSRFVHANALELPHRLPKLAEASDAANCDAYFEDYLIGGAKHSHHQKQQHIHAHSHPPVAEEVEEDPVETMIATYLFQKKVRRKRPAQDSPPLKLENNNNSAVGEGTINPKDTVQNSIYERNKTSWEAVLGEFHEYAEKHINVKDLSEVANLREPAPLCIPILNYLCLLFGLSPSWAVAKKYIFKDVNILKRFLIHVNPLSLPTAHLRSAVAYRNENISFWDKSAEAHIFKPIHRLIGWTTEFNSLAEAVLAVDEYRQGQSTRTSYNPNNKRSPQAQRGAASSAAFVADIHDDRDLRKFYIDIKNSQQSDAFWQRFEKYYPLVFETNVVDDDDEAEEDTFNDVDLTTEAALSDIRAAIQRSQTQITMSSDTSSVSSSSTGATTTSKRSAAKSSKLKRDPSNRNVANFNAIKLASINKQSSVAGLGISKLLSDISTEKISKQMEQQQFFGASSQQLAGQLGGNETDNTDNESVHSNKSGGSTHSSSRVLQLYQQQQLQKQQQQQKLQQQQQIQMQRAPDLSRLAQPKYKSSSSNLIGTLDRRASTSKISVSNSSGKLSASTTTTTTGTSTVTNAAKLRSGKASTKSVKAAAGVGSNSDKSIEAECCACPANDLGSVLTDPRLVALLYG